MTIADDVAAHISTNFTVGLKTTGMIFDALIDRPKEVTGSAATRYDMVLVENLDESYTPAGWGHEDSNVGCAVRVWARVPVAAEDMKARLKVIVDEVRHTLNSHNHALSGYTWHHARQANYHIDKEKISAPNRAEGYAVLLFEGRTYGGAIA